jgi:AAA+ ATPase superfamily predicted ATPase
MTVFVGRENEEAALQAELALIKETGAARFVWMRGRRRVGKSRLVQEFCDRSDTRYCFYQAPRRAKEHALADFADTVAESSLLAASQFEEISFDSWPAALRASVQGSERANPAIVVIDELPYLTELDSGFAGDLQKAWDRALEEMPVLLICVGSDVRMMESLVGERSPLHGRPTKEMKIAPLSPAAVAAITTAPDSSAAFDRYLVVGGFPLLAASWPAAVDLPGFLASALADDQTPFATTALRIMASEFEGELQAAKVIEAIGHGETAYNRIQARSGVKGNTLTDALDVLVERKGFVAKELPYAAPLGRTAAKYTVLDPYLRFWLRFVGPHMDELSRGRSDLAIERIERDWSAYRGKAIEPVVRRSVERLLTDGSLSERLGSAHHVGAWWRRDHSIEVDLVGGDKLEPDKIGFIGSVKWRQRSPFSSDDLGELAEGRTHVPGAKGAKLVAVSNSGFEDGLGLDANFGPDDLIGAW